ncbi:oligosaccharide flippase family protein [Aporhodopirellula rubra]|nr:oligosaccharide flippase family protein [Aporhodopirellula rubra]
MRSRLQLVSVFTLRFFYLFSSFALSSILARSLSQVDFGVFIVSQSIVLLMYSIAVAGVPNYIVREVAILDPVERCKPIRFAATWSMTILLASVVCFIVIAALIKLDYSVLSGVLVGIPAAGILVLTVVSNATLRGTGQVAGSQISDMLLRPGLFLLITSVFWLSPDLIMTPVVAMTAFLSAVTVGFVFSIFLFRKISLSPSPAYSSIEHRRAMSSVKRLAGVDWVHAVSLYSTPLLISAFASEADVSHFRVAFQVSLLLPTGLYVANAIFYPRLCRAFHDGRSCDVKRVFARCCLIGSGFSWAAATMLWFFGEKFILLFYGEIYLEAMSAILILAVAQLFNTATGPLDLLLTAAGLENVVLKARSFALVGQLVVVPILSHFLGATGAAIGYAFISILWNAFLAIFGYYRFGGLLVVKSGFHGNNEVRE